MSGASSRQALVPNDLLVDGYPRFSAAEMQHRREALLHIAAEAGVDRVLLVGVDRSGSAIQWLTNWPVTREGYVIVDGDDRDALYVQFFNHVPLAQRIAVDADVAWRGPSAAETIAEELRRRSHHGALGFIGPMPAQLHRQLTEAGYDLVALNPAYTKLRQIKSAEEIQWLRIGAALSDAGILALHEGLRSGLTQWELADLVERAYVPQGGTTHIHYFGVTPMAEPSQANPAQYQSAQQVQPGDAVTIELSAAFWGYPGQVLRSFTVEADPTPLYADLHDVAQAAFDNILSVLRDGTTPEEVMDAAGIIEQSGYTTLDDLVHGFGGGYFPPILGSRSRNHDPASACDLQAGMTVVVQPNVVTPDRRAGVQTGELVHITANGAERLHRAPGGLVRVG